MTLVLSESKLLRIGCMTTFYIAQGLPIGLFTIAMAAWLSANGQSAGAVAALIGAYYLPWSYKFFIAPIMDRFTYLPMGRRRIWLISSQAIILFGLGYAAFVGPMPNETVIINMLAYLIASCSAMQDVAIDGLAVDILPEEEQGSVSAFTFGGQALGIAAGGAAGGYLLQEYGSTVAFLAFMPLNALFLIFAILLREQRGEKLLPWTKGEAGSVTLARQAHGFVEVIVVTFKSLTKRDSLLMMGGDAFGRAAGGLFLAFWPVFATKEAGWSTSAYSSMLGTVGLAAAVGCMIIGSGMISLFGARLSSMIAYGGYAIMALVFLVAPDLAKVGYVFVILSIYWNVTDTLSSVCGNPLRMRLADKRVAATQFTIYNSFANLVVPTGAFIYATYAGQGNGVVMPIAIGMIMVFCLFYSQLRVGGRKEKLEELQPRVD